MINSKHLKWNTGRSYTADGQRIAAIVVNPDGVLMVDYDRMITYYLPNCPLDRSEIMRRYDANDRCEHYPPQMDGAAFVALRTWLENLAKTN